MVPNLSSRAIHPPKINSKATGHDLKSWAFLARVCLRRSRHEKQSGSCGENKPHQFGQHERLHPLPPMPEAVGSTTFRVEAKVGHVKGIPAFLEDINPGH